MVQSNMAMTSSGPGQVLTSTGQSLVYETIELKPEVTVSNKKVWVNGDWEDRKFYNIPNTGRMSNVSELERWCIDTLGKPKYLGKWFKLSQTIVLDEKTYMLWLLVK